MDVQNKPLVNRVANSSLITINLEDYFPSQPIVQFDIKDYLFQGLILKEKEFREALKAHDWVQYQDHHLAVFCSTDAIVPIWAYMLVSTSAKPFAKTIFQGTPAEMLKKLYMQAIDQMTFEQYQDQRIVIKGCSDKPVPAAAYLDIAARLQPYAQSIMYGEPCSTVPIFKRPRKLR